MSDDKDNELEPGLYDDGHWKWDSVTESLGFVSDRPVVADSIYQLPTQALRGPIEFRDDIDVIEQLRYRRRYQRKIKPGEPEVITLQDVKDLSIYTAPVSILSPAVINILHLATTDRFLRAIILCMQYYLQTADEMAHQLLELESKVRTTICDKVEIEIAENLTDLRLLVAKEYSCMIMGVGELSPFHHMGPDKQHKSLSAKDGRLCETILRMCVQIVWLALGRRSFHEIELEISRVFKSDIFNTVEHYLKSGYIDRMSKEEKAVLLGPCSKNQHKLQVRSPMIKEVFIRDNVDYRLMGLGVINYSQMTTRLQYMLLAITAPEEYLSDLGVVVGILGSPRHNYDTVLKFIEHSVEKSKSSISAGTISPKSFASVSHCKKSYLIVNKLYDDIVLPQKETKQSHFPLTFPDQPFTVRPSNKVQRLRWINRLRKLLVKDQK